ncbi:MAG: putative metal-binding motif-containing protein [Deltaproteobacteria bacterium]|nr:putative metal-binding motif-containing protein [Deltaproteobacteria bacterium]
MRPIPYLLPIALLLGCPGGGSDDSKDTEDSIDVVAQDDEDGDGYSVSEGDCDDNDATMNPGASEICDGLDNNCNGETDEGVLGAYYQDVDGDGFGNAGASTTACEQPEGYVSNPDDCDDAEAKAYPGNTEVCDGIDNDCNGTVDDGVGTTYYADADKDSFGDPVSATVYCEGDEPTGYVLDNTDCDDSTAAAFPGNLEICDTIDNDCDGSVDEDVTTTYYADLDDDGYGDASMPGEACALPTGYAENPDDCDDGNDEVNPGATELCNGIDDNCDGNVDEDSAADASTWYADADNDTYGDAASSTVSCSRPFGHVADDTDCDDGNGSVNPGATELCNGIDDDCDGNTDEDSAADATTWYADADGDGYGDASNSDVECYQPAGYVTDNTDCNDTTTAANPAATEVCDGIDNDCDGTADEGDAADASTWYADSDRDSYGDASSTTTACSQPVGYVSDSTDCDDGRYRTNPGADEWCNGIDDDCDGSTDEDSAVDASTWYADADSDGYGDPSLSDVECYQPTGYVSDDTDCDDGRYETNPGAAEYCNTIDDDCDGDIDEDSAVDVSTWYRDADGDSYGSATWSDVDCDQPAGYVATPGDCDDLDAATYPGATEYCDGEDDDCDGIIDEDDAADASTWYADADSDGYGNPAVSDVECSAPAGYVADNTDCDDSRALTNPGASEYCNGIDDDCDGTTDEDSAVDATTWYADSDGDSYGDPAVSDVECSVPGGYVADNTDCDDGRYETNPGATEYCNGEDDDCDGTVDEDAAADASTWYRDADNDGYGDAASSDVACYQPTGYVSDNTDCDDLENGTYPGATEYCDGEDNDCDGAIDEVDGVADGTTYYADDDSDTYGDASDTVSACSAPSGYVDNDYDCNDADAGEPRVADPMGGSGSGDGSAGNPFDLLQDAIDAANECVLGYGGTYNEYDIDLGGKSLDVWGVEGWNSTRIDPSLTTCNYTNPTDCHPVFRIDSGSGAMPHIHGFTVAGGTGFGSSSSTSTTCADSDPSHAADSTCTVTTWEFCGGGAYINGDDPMFSEMVFTDNDLPDFDQVSTGAWSQTWVYSFGGGICALDSITSVSDSWFVDNSADQGGGAYGGSGTTMDSTRGWFDDNTASDGAAMALSASGGTLENTVFACNNATTDGGGLFTESSGTTSVVNSVMYQNTAGTASTNGSQAYLGSGTTGSVDNGIFQASTASPLLYSAGTGALRYSDLVNSSTGGTYSGAWTAGSGITGTGSLLAGVSCDGNPWNDDVGLNSSNGVDWGDPLITDADGTRSDIGAEGGPEGTW